MSDREKLIDFLRKTEINVVDGHSVLAEVCFVPSVFTKMADNLIANGVIVSPCKEGDTVYKIVKFCDENIGYKEFYRPSKEFEDPCPHYEPAEWECDEQCAACDDYDNASYCSLNLDIFCEMCKERMAIQKDVFSFSMMRRVFNTPMFDKSTPLKKNAIPHPKGS